jgi:LysM repeat protein
VVVDGEVLIDNINPTDPGSSANHVWEDDAKYVRYDGEYIEAYAKQESKKLAAGTRKWKVRAIDKAGNSRDTGERTLYVDTSAPVIQLDVLGAHANLAFRSTSHEGTALTTTDQTPTFEGVADAGTTINVVVESDPIICETEAQDDSSWACTPDAKIPYGRHTVTIKATDQAGNVTTLPKLYLIVSPARLETAIIETETAPKQETTQETATCKTYTVQPGDSLYSIAFSQLGDENKYLDIVEWNKEKYPSLETNRGVIEPGWELILSAACVEEKSKQAMEADEAEVQTYDVKVNVVDTEQQPVKGAKVTLFSTPREAITDENGIAAFRGVEKGEHKVVIAYNGQTGEQPIRLEGDMEEFKFTVQIKPSNPFTNLYVIAVVGILVVIIAGLLYLLSRRRNR